MMAKNLAVAESAADGAFEENSFFEYHIYKLSKTTTLKDNEKKQIELTSAQKVPVIKKYTYKASDYNKKVEVVLNFKNDKKSNLGLPLPKGKVRVFKSDGDSLEFAGEDKIEHTAENSDISLSLGNAFDITAERVRTNSSSGNKWSEESYEITLKNAKSEPVKVETVEKLYGSSNWKIVSSSQNYTKKRFRYRNI